MVGPLLVLLWLWFWPVFRWADFTVGATHKAKTAHALLGTLTGVVMFPLALLFLLADVVFNIVFGSFIFLESPREWLFTTRLARWKNSTPDTEGYRLANELCYQLSKIDPYHC